MSRAAISTRAQREAERWFARLMAPDCSAGDRAAFEQWRRQNPAHTEAYAATERLLTSVDELAESDPRMQTLLRDARQRAAPPAARAWNRVLPQLLYRPLRWALAAGAVVGVVAAVAVGLLHRGPEPVQYEASTERQTLELADGSRVELDVTSRLSARFTVNRREVDLETGRALFEVAPDSSRPFTVRAGNGSVAALGTRFQVEREGYRVTVTLAEGSVVVRHETPPKSAPRQQVRLQPGEQLIYSDDASTWIRQRADIDAATSWSRGRLIFRNTPLARVVTEVNRYSPRKIVLADPSLADLPVHGNFVSGDAAQVVAAFEAVLPLRVDYRAAEILLYHD